jgi:tetratricopeptide (TPR) repeat protein
MLEPVTTSLIFVGAALVSGVLGNRSDARFKAYWDKFRHNLEQHRPHANHALVRAAYRAYLQATLQSCAALLEGKGLSVEAWFKLGTLPEKMTLALRSLLSNPAAGVFTQANKKWLEDVSHDHITKLKEFDKEKLDPPFEYENEEFAALLGEIEVLMQPAEAKDREQRIRAALGARVLSDLEKQFGEAPGEFKALVSERWFEFLCAGFQYDINHRQEIANAFESGLLAKLVARGEVQNRLTDFGGESLKRIQAAQGWVLQEQREGFDGLESLLTLLLPLLSFASDEAARNDTLMILIRAESGRVIDVVLDEGAKTRASADRHFGDLRASIDRLAPRSSNEPEPLIHTLPTHQAIEGRHTECATILRAMCASEQHVVAFAAPGGFGKTALLAKVVREISADGRTFLERVALPNLEAIETCTGALLHVDCRNDVKLSALFANAGRLVDQEQAFQDIYNSEAALSDKLQEVFSRLSTNEKKRTWFVFDNFEPLLNDTGEIGDIELSDFFSAIFAGGHSVFALIATRDMPKFSPREKVLELVAVGGSLFEGLPLDNCLAYLRKNGAAKGLGDRAKAGTAGGTHEIDAILKSFALKVHRIPLALVWVIGYLRDTDYTLKEVLERQELFADFEHEQAKDAVRYMNKGLKRLHYEQLKIQTSESLPVLRLLAFFKRAVPKGALAHLLGEIELNRTLTRLERNELITHKDTGDAYTKYLNDPLAINLYSLHPVICENEFFDRLADREALYETAAGECWTRAVSANLCDRFAYAIDLYDCAEELYEHLTKDFRRADLLTDYAATSLNKGVALAGLIKLSEAVAECDKAIVILERLVAEDQQHFLTGAYAIKGDALARLARPHDAIAECDKAIAILEPLVNEARGAVIDQLIAVYMIKGNALFGLTKLDGAVAETEKAIEMLEPLVNQEEHSHLAKELAAAYVNRGNAFVLLTKLRDAVAEYDKGIAIVERLVNQEHEVHLANKLAVSHMNKGNALKQLAELPETLAEYDKGIAILERLVNEEHQEHVAHDLALAYLNKSSVLLSINQWLDAVAESAKAITILERLINEDQQVHLADKLAMAYLNKGNALQNLLQLTEAVAEYDKAIAIHEQLINRDQQVQLANNLASVYLNKGRALVSLTKLPEAIAEYDKAIGIREHLVNEEQQLYVAKDLASAYMSRGNALFSLTKLDDALSDYDKAIVINERLVNIEPQGHLANDLAMVYWNKALVLGQQQDWDRALSCLEKCFEARTLCVEQANMYWIMPELLRTLRYRMMILPGLQRWPLAARDVLRFRSLYEPYVGSGAIDDGLKEAARKEFAEMIASLVALSTEQRELLYAELGDAAETVRSFVSESERE